MILNKTPRAMPGTLASTFGGLQSLMFANPLKCQTYKKYLEILNYDDKVSFKQSKKSPTFSDVLIYNILVFVCQRLLTL